MTLILLVGQQLSAKHNFQNEGANTLLDEAVQTIAGGNCGSKKNLLMQFRF